MSVIEFSSNGYDVNVGWYKPLQYYFLVITDYTTQRTVYSNLNDPKGPGLTLEYIAGVLSRFGISTPSEIFTLLERHRSMNVGSFVVRMREPDRIPRILELVREAWEGGTDMRLFQLLYAVLGSTGDHFNTEDTKLEAALRAYLKKEGTNDDNEA